MYFYIDDGVFLIESHPESVVRTGLQVLHFCISASATQGKPLGTVVLTVLHLHNTHKPVRHVYHFKMI